MSLARTYWGIPRDWGAIPPKTRRPWNGNTNRRPKAGGLYWLISGPMGEGGIAPQSLGIPRYVRARLMVFTLLLGKLKPSRRPREAIWVGNTYPLGGAKNFTMLQEVRIDPIRTPWEKLKIFTMLQEVRIDPIGRILKFSLLSQGLLIQEFVPLRTIVKILGC